MAKLKNFNGLTYYPEIIGGEFEKRMGGGTTPREMLWKQKSKVEWIGEGDKDTKFFSFINPYTEKEKQN